MNIIHEMMAVDVQKTIKEINTAEELSLKSKTND